AGHQVDIANCGSEGIAAASANYYDLIFMDVSMPDMTGMEATQQIRQLGGTAATTPIIAITGHALKGYQEMCLAAGMNGYATKPISKLDLLGLVDKWCDSSATAQRQLSDSSATAQSILDRTAFKLVILRARHYKLKKHERYQLLQVNLGKRV
ncbi:MAG: hypothetical protein RLZ75_2199, partial [Pseudomonadota bacterium]